MGWKEFILPTKRLLLAVLRLTSNKNNKKKIPQSQGEVQQADDPVKPSWIHNFSVIHYFVDLWARYVFKIRPALARGGLVSCDRYFYDVLTQNNQYHLEMLYKNAQLEYL